MYRNKECYAVPCHATYYADMLMLAADDDADIEAMLQAYAAITMILTLSLLPPLRLLRLIRHRDDIIAAAHADEPLPAMLIATCRRLRHYFIIR